MVRRVSLVAFALLMASVSLAGAAVPEGPRLAIAASGGLITTGPLGEDPQVLLDDRGMGVGQRPSWSADGNWLAFFAAYANKGLVVAMLKADGSGLRTFPRATLEAEDPVIAPDGRSIAFPQIRLVKVLPGRESYLLKSSIWLLDVEDGSVRRLTRWRLNTFLWPSSYSPDGSTLAATYFSRRGFRAVAINLRSGKFSLLARDALEPTYSPDGSRFAFVRYLNWRLNGINERVPAMDELRVGRVGSVTGARLLLRRRGFFAWPSWDPSGSRLVFTHSRADEIGDRAPEAGDRVMTINADGTCLRKVFSDPGAILYGAAWRPGPGREAGPLSC